LELRLPCMGAGGNDQCFYALQLLQRAASLRFWLRRLLSSDYGGFPLKATLADKSPERRSLDKHAGWVSSSWSFAYMGVTRKLRCGIARTRFPF
jgi:hypothetical protein